MLHIVRFLTAAHIYSAYLLFWMAPTAVMMACGYAMSEFLGKVTLFWKSRNPLSPEHCFLFLLNAILQNQTDSEAGSPS